MIFAWTYKFELASRPDPVGGKYCNPIFLQTSWEKRKNTFWETCNKVEAKSLGKGWRVCR